MRIMMIHRCHETKEDCPGKDKPFVYSRIIDKIEFLKGKDKGKIRLYAESRYEDKNIDDVVEIF